MNSEGTGGGGGGGGGEDGEADGEDLSETTDEVPSSPSSSERRSGVKPYSDGCGGVIKWSISTTTSSGASGGVSAYKGS